MRHLIVPGLLDKPTPADAPDIPRRLQTLLSKGDKVAARTGYANTLFGLFGVDYCAQQKSVQQDLPTAAISYYADTGQHPPNAHYLLHADPVYLKPDQDRLLAFDFYQQPPSQQQADQFAAAFNPHFARDGLQLLTPNPSRWYVSVAQMPDLQTRPLIDVIGRNIDLFLPQGKDAAQWINWANETQMLFYNLPVNTERENTGQLPVNGLWFSGGGLLPSVSGSGFAHTSGDCILLDGLQKISCGKSPAHLVVGHSIGRAAINHNSTGWAEALQQLDTKLQQWMQEALILYPCNGTAWHWQPNMKRRWWRPTYRA